LLNVIAGNSILSANLANPGRVDYLFVPRALERLAKVDKLLEFAAALQV
jgi:hypothetical protein